MSLVACVLAPLLGSGSAPCASSLSSCALWEVFS
jgi:hypothetical protein